MSYLVTIVQQGLQTRVKLGKQDNAFRAINWAIKNQHGVCVKEVSALEMLSDEEHKRAQTLWRAISLDREITPKLMQQIYSDKEGPPRRNLRRSS